MKSVRVDSVIVGGTTYILKADIVKLLYMVSEEYESPQTKEALKEIAESIDRDIK